MEEENIIINYEIKDNAICIDFHNGDNNIIPYTFWNESKVINKAKKQIEDNTKKCKSNLKNDILWSLANIFAIGLNVFMMMYNSLEEVAFIMFGAFTVVYLSMLVDKLMKISNNTSLLKKLNFAKSFLKQKEKEFDKKKNKKLSNKKQEKDVNMKENRKNELKDLKNTLEGIIHQVPDNMLMNDVEEDDYIQNKYQKVKTIKR